MFLDRYFTVGNIHHAEPFITFTNKKFVTRYAQPVRGIHPLAIDHLRLSRIADIDHIQRAERTARPAVYARPQCHVGILALHHHGIAGKHMGVFR
ncbi:hypothetical protein D3C87_1976090 [compost metagenome]